MNMDGSNLEPTMKTAIIARVFYQGKRPDPVQYIDPRLRAMGAHLDRLDPKLRAAMVARSDPRAVGAQQTQNLDDIILPDGNVSKI